MTLIDLVSDSPFRAGAAGAALMLALVWLVSVRIKDASIVDMFWGLGFAVIAAICLLVTENLAPLTAATLWLVILWGVRLFVHLGTRWRREGEEDYRYQKMRAYHGAKFWWRSLFTVFILQGVLMWLVAMPYMAAAYFGGIVALPGVTVIGLIIALAGLIMETLSDRQLTQFRANAQPGELLDSGWWARTRHPNYFADAMFWWGIYIAVVAATPEAIWTIFAPIIMSYLLMNVSGAKMLERRLIKKPGYADYMARTNRFVPRIFGNKK
jgi:steroid 5-alpha reductase family enzyme